MIANISEAMTDTPVILLAGARQTGKSTLLQSLVAPQSSVNYFTLDNPETYAAVQSNPHGFISGHSGTLCIDEVQRVPDLFLAIKHAVDQDRTPGRFLLTGSANVLLIPRLSESLAGRMEIVTLRPLAQLEMMPRTQTKTRTPAINLVDAWFDAACSVPECPAVDRVDFVNRLLTGGYPEVVARSQPKRRTAWFESYLDTVLQRDIRDLAQIEGLTQMPRLLETMAHRTTGVLNFADISRTLGMPQTSIKRYIALLETVYLIESLPAWTHRASHSAQKSPKYYLNDSGLFAHVLGLTAKSILPNSLAYVTGLNGALVETFVLAELRKLLSWADSNATLMHYRTSTGIEVDFVLQDKAGNVVGVEVKSSLTVGANDFKGLRHLRELLGDKFVRGIVLHPGDSVTQWDSQMASVPMSCLWDIFSEVLE